MLFPLPDRLMDVRRCPGLLVALVGRVLVRLGDLARELDRGRRNLPDVDGRCRAAGIVVAIYRWSEVGRTEPEASQFSLRVGVVASLAVRDRSRHCCQIDRQEYGLSM